MSLKVTTVDSRNPNYPAALLSKKDQVQFSRISIIGDPEILKRQMLGLFCSIKCPGDLILRTYHLARVLRDAGVPGNLSLVSFSNREDSRQRGFRLHSTHPAAIWALRDRAAGAVGG